MYQIPYYLREMLIIAVPAAVVFCCFWPYRKRALQAMGLRTGLGREIGLILFIMCLFGVLAVTLWPVYWMEDSPGLWGDIELLVDRPLVMEQCQPGSLPDVSRLLGGPDPGRWFLYHPQFPG